MVHMAKAKYIKNSRGEYVIIPELSEPPVRTLGATIPENESHIFLPENESHIFR